MEGGRIDLKPADWQNTIKHLEDMLATMKFGSITLIVQDGKIVQIEKNEKIRLQ
ncbi:YezD family protein [Robertmurraya sp. Marseille-Q9965]